MSNALVDNIGNASGSLVTPTQYVVRGSAKAWANLNGTGTIALRDSLNVSSVVDNGTGDYGFNFSNNTASTSCVGSGSFVWGANGNQIIVNVTLVSRYIVQVLEANSFVDRSLVMSEIQGDLA